MLPHTNSFSYHLITSSLHRLYSPVWRCVTAGRKGRENTLAERKGRRDCPTADTSEAGRTGTVSDSRKEKTEMLEAESAQEAAAEELSTPTPEIENELEAEQKSASSSQTDSAPVQPTQSKP